MACQDPFRLDQIDPKLVFFLSGCDVLVRLWINIWIDPEGALSRFSHSGGDPVDIFEFFFAFDVKEEDLLLESKGDLFIGLSDAGENDLFGVSPYFQHSFEFPSRNDVKTRPHLFHIIKDRKIRICLCGVADEGIGGRKSGRQLFVMVLDRLGGVDIERRSMLLGQSIDRDALAMELSVYIIEVMHEGPIIERGKGAVNRQKSPFCSFLPKVCLLRFPQNTDLLNLDFFLKRGYRLRTLLDQII